MNIGEGYIKNYGKLSEFMETETSLKKLKITTVSEKPFVFAGNSKVAFLLLKT